MAAPKTVEIREKTGATRHWAQIILHLAEWEKFTNWKITALAHRNVLWPQKIGQKEIETILARADRCLHPEAQWARRSNQWAHWQVCKICGLRLSYEQIQKKQVQKKQTQRHIQKQQLEAMQIQLEQLQSTLAEIMGPTDHGGADPDGEQLRMQ